MTLHANNIFQKICVVNQALMLSLSLSMLAIACFNSCSARAKQTLSAFALGVSVHQRGQRVQRL